MRQRAGQAHHALAVSIQELVAQPGGQWQLDAAHPELQHRADDYASLHGTLHVAGADVGTIDVKTDFDIPANSADVIDTTLHASAKLPAGDIDYKIEGTIDDAASRRTSSSSTARAGCRRRRACPDTWR